MYTSSNLNVWPITEYTSRDVATAFWDTLDPKLGKIIICSFYWDINHSNPPTQMVEAGQFARDKGYMFLVCGDSNAHSTLYNCKDTNKRGKTFELTLAKLDLIPSNRGNKFTFEGGMGRSIIDVTLVTSRFEHRIKNWRVSSKDMKSDHNLIEFEMEVEEPEVVYYTDYKNGNHEQFKKDCESEAANLALKFMNEPATINRVEKRCNSVTEIIQRNAKKTFQT